jgi:hypothetical protein
MKMIEFEEIGNIPLKSTILQELIGNYRFPRNKVSALEKRGEIIRLKKGLYVTSEKKSRKPVSCELLANHLYGPSYLSLESALSFYGMIPERVFAIRSMTSKRAKKFKTSLGNFYYTTVSEKYFNIGIRQEIVENEYAFLIATPTKAVCDMIVATPNLRLQSVRAMQAYLLEDLRIDFDSIKNLDKSIVKQCMETGKKKGTLLLLLNFMNTKLTN